MFQGISRYLQNTSLLQEQLVSALLDATNLSHGRTDLQDVFPSVPSQMQEVPPCQLGWFDSTCNLIFPWIARMLQLLEHPMVSQPCGAHTAVPGPSAAWRCSCLGKAAPQSLLWHARRNGSVNPRWDVLCSSQNEASFKRPKAALWSVNRCNALHHVRVFCSGSQWNPRSAAERCDL